GKKMKEIESRDLKWGFELWAGKLVLTGSRVRGNRIPNWSQENRLWITRSLLAPMRKLIMLTSCNLAMVCFCVVVGDLFKRLPQPENSHDVLILYATGALRMAFDPTKSRDYKVVQLFACLHDELEIQVYSSETGN
ncbi:hypothetical protein Tco_1547896, partial [Tanacetum coccineum]